METINSHQTQPPPVPLRQNIGGANNNNSNNNNNGVSSSPADEFKKKLQLQLQNGSPNNNFQFKKNQNNSNGLNSPQGSPLHTSSTPSIEHHGVSNNSNSNSNNNNNNNNNNLNSTFVETITPFSPPNKPPPPIPPNKSKSTDRLSVKLLKNNSKSSFSKDELPPTPPPKSVSLPTTPTNSNIPKSCNIESLPPPPPPQNLYPQSLSTNNNNNVPSNPSSSTSSPSTSPQLPPLYSKYNKVPLPQLPLSASQPTPIVQSTSSPSILSMHHSHGNLPPPPTTNKVVPPLPPMRFQNQEMYSNNSNSNNNNKMASYEESNSTTTSEGGLTPTDYESKLHEIASQPPSTPRLTHESKVIPSEIELLVKYQPSASASCGNLNSVVEKLFIFSPCSTIDEILSIIIPNFQTHFDFKNAKQTTNNEWETTSFDGTIIGGSSEFSSSHESFALFNTRQSTTVPLHKEKTILELQLQDQDVLVLKTVSLNFTLVKVTIPQFTEGVLAASATVKFNQFTSIRSIIRRLYLKFHQNVDISKHGIFLMNGGTDHDETIPLDEDELFSSYNITVNSNLVFRTLSNQENDLHSSQKSLNLKIIISTTFSRTNTLNLMFDPRDSVSKAIKVTGLRTGLLDSLNKCGFYLTPSEDDDEGFWMDEDLTLENYNLKNHTFLSFKERCKKYIVIIKPGERKCTFKFDQFAKVSTLFNILVNNENIKNPKDYHMVIKNSNITLEKHRYIWSYDIKCEIEFKEYPNKLLLFNPQNGEKNFVYVDFNDPIKDVCARLSQSFTTPIDLPLSSLSSSSKLPSSISINDQMNNNSIGSSANNGSAVNTVRERSFTFKRLGHLVNNIDSRKSLRDQGVNPNDALMLEVIEEITNVNDDGSGATTLPTTTEDLVNDGTILSEAKQLNIWEEPADSSENIIYSTTVTNNLNPEIDAATLNKLIIRLTNPDFHDLTFMKTFLMTYSSYTTTTTLLKKLFERFQVPTHIDERERLSAQLRVANVIKYWVEHHYEDFCHESTKLMVDFVDTYMMIAFPTLGIQIRNCILKRTCGVKSELVRTRSNGALTSPRGNLSYSFNSSTSSIATNTTSTTSTASINSIMSSSSLSNSNLSLSFNSGNNSPAIMPSSPRPISSSSSLSSSLLKSPQPKKIYIPETKVKGFVNPRNLFDFDDEEIARQLTLYDFQLYTAIKPTEFLNQAWNKPSMAARKSPTILKIISRFNDLSLWVVSLILEPDRVKTRAKRLKRIISIADELRKLNNFNTCIAFISGINNSAILRLKFTKALLSKKYLDILESLEKEMSCEGNYKNYREKLKYSDPPVVPYIGVYLTDLTFIEEGNPNIIRGNLINFAKYYLIYRVISEIQQYQWTEYHLNVAPIIQTFIRDIQSSNSDELYHLSLAKEPRNALKSDIF